MTTLFQDLRYAIRMLLKSPGFTAVAVITLALGIGANTAIFSIIDTVLLRPLPFHASSRLVTVWERNWYRNRTRNVVGPANFLRWREENHVFEEMAAVIDWPANVTDSTGEPERVLVGVVSPNLFSMLGVRPLIGRSFAKDEEEPKKGNVVLLSRGYWQRRYAGDKNIVGRTIQVSAHPATIIGVMPDRINFPRAAEMWQPFVITSQRRQWDGRYLTVLARLKPRVTVSQAQADMDVVTAHTRAEQPDFNTGWDANVVPLSDQLVGNIRRPLLVLLGAVLFVMLIACANIASMLLARASVRKHEMAVRLALGATQGRVIRQVLTESTFISILGGIAGLLLAYSILNLLLAVIPNEIPAFRVISINPHVLGFAIVITIATGLGCGFASALHGCATTPQQALAEGGRGASTGRAQLGILNTLVIVEAATAVILLAAAGLLINSFVHLLRVDPGFDPTHVITMQVSLPGSTYASPERQAAYYQRALDRIRSVPGVVAAGAISGLPLEGGGVTAFRADDLPAPNPSEEPTGYVRIVNEDYFRALRIPLLRGRWFDPGRDRPNAAFKGLVINDVVAQALWPDQNPIGKRISLDWNGLYDHTGTIHAEVVGVVASVRLLSLNLSARRSTLYFYLPQVPNLFMTFAVRTSGDPNSLAALIHQQIASVDPNQPVANIRTMEDIIAASVQQPRFTTALLTGFAALALLLACIGIYGVISYSVAQRTLELGLRMALGAQRRNILWLLINQGFRPVLLGIVLGLGIALIVTRLMGALLFNVRPGDPFTMFVVISFLSSAALLAIVFPAWRAARVDPMVALRYE